MVVGTGTVTSTVKVMVLIKVAGPITVTFEDRLWKHLSPVRVGVRKL